MKLIGRCGDCAHFFRYRENYGECQSGKVAGHQDDIISDGAIAGDPGSILIGEDFGCIHWKERSDS